MPGSIGQMLGKIMGPLQTAIGLGAAPFTGGMSLPMAMSGLSSMTSPGGLLGASTSPGSLPSIKAPALTSAPVGPPPTPDIPSPAGSGLSLSVPGVGATSGTGAGTSSDISNMIAQANPFAAFGQ